MGAIRAITLDVNRKVSPGNTSWQGFGVSLPLRRGLVNLIESNFDIFNHRLVA